MHEIDQFAQRWKTIIAKVQQQHLSKQHEEILRRRYKKEKMNFLAKAQNMPDVNFGMLFEEIENELEQAIEKARDNHDRKYKKEFIPKIAKKISDAFKKANGQK